MRKILVIGSFMTDLVFRSHEFVREGETVTGLSFNRFPGGKGANQAVAAARSGAEVTMMGKLGKDDFGEEQIASLQASGIDHHAVLFTDEAVSGVGNPQLDDHGRNRIVIIPGANSLFTPVEIEHMESLIEDNDIIVLQLEIPLETVYRAIEIAHRRDKTIILNPAPAQRIDAKHASMVNWIVPNEHEAETLSGIRVDSLQSAERASEKLMRQGFGNVVITLGSHGSFYKTADAEDKIDAFEVNAVDSTAAGDEFIGAFASQIAKDSDISNALVYSSAASALAVTKLGAQASLPTSQEIEAFLHERNAV
ncbi:ribokinase [Bifidobacterium sp. ESL0732]|uniref:ribokinase n=1 Tax=Bifidobacterium sp. ESL0732 TaxID=2983222 RepID=UPI0023F93738|nr:ribokinase [Bifidobacterium sp. ESL0732]WEV64709.1 ribokinase [Bifidobacterium sp. ESL0732]